VKYATPQAFERALSDRLKRQAAEQGVELDRLRKRVAFERFLARLFGRASSRWVLKGGYALELWAGPFEAEARNLDLATTNIKDAHKAVEDYARTLAQR